MQDILHLPALGRCGQMYSAAEISVNLGLTVRRLNLSLLETKSVYEKSLQTLSRQQTFKQRPAIHFAVDWFDHVFGVGHHADDVAGS